MPRTLTVALAALAVLGALAGPAFAGDIASDLDEIVADNQTAVCVATEACTATDA